MSFNPLDIKPVKSDKWFEDWKKLYPKAYDKMESDPYTKVRIILMNGTEFEQNWFYHNFARHCPNNDLRRDIALIRRSEQQQQKKISYLKPKDETALEHAIGYEQLAIDLTAIMARREKDAYVKKSLDFALLEDFDHLYRFSDLLEMEEGILAEKLVGGYTEIMPGRPTIAEHRYPYDDVRRGIDNKTADPLTKLQTAIITAAEQQTMNYYMNIGTFYPGSDLGRRLFLEIGMIEEQHVTQYESLMDASATWLECALLHEYAECYLYHSLMEDETDEYVRSIWEAHLTQEISHLHEVARLIAKYEKKDARALLNGGEFPEPLAFNKNAEANKTYIRQILGKTVNNTAMLEEIVPLDEVPCNSEFYKYNSAVNKSPAYVTSHNVIDKYILEAGEDYRFEEQAHPVKALRNRLVDNTEVGRRSDRCD